MTDNPVDDAQAAVEEVAPPDPPTPSPPDPPSSTESSRPNWVDEILDAIRSSAPDPVTPDPGTAPEPIAPDETPVRKPWTHWGRR